jgi:hypothetical protein
MRRIMAYGIYTFTFLTLFLGAILPAFARNKCVEQPLQYVTKVDTYRCPEAQKFLSCYEEFEIRCDDKVKKVEKRDLEKCVSDAIECGPPIPQPKPSTVHAWDCHEQVVARHGVVNVAVCPAPGLVACVEVIEEKCIDLNTQETTVKRTERSLGHCGSFEYCRMGR